MSLDKTLIRQRDFDGAQQLLHESLEGMKALQRPRDIIGVRYRLATLAYHRQQFDDARKML